jgi:hypothetical protein
MAEGVRRNTTSISHWGKKNHRHSAGAQYLNYWTLTKMDRNKTNKNERVKK